MPADREARFRPGMSQEDLIANYQKIGSRPPFTKSDIEKAYQPYGLKIDPARKKASDKQLHKTAAMAVVKWHKGQKTAANKPSASQAPSTQSAPASTATSAARSTTPARSVAPARAVTTRQFYDDDYVARAMRTVGLAGVSPADVPQEHRRTYADLVAYLNRIKAQRSLAISNATGGGRTLIR